MSNETKVGALFLFFCGLMVWLTVTMRGCPLAPKTELTIHFDTLEGLKKGDDVVFAGVPIGKVGDVRLIEGGVEAICALEKEKIQDPAGALVIPEAVDAYVEDTTVLGGKRIVLLPRKLPKGEKPKPLNLAVPLPGVARPPIARSAAQVAERLAKFTEEEGPLYRVANRLADAMDNFADITKGLKEGKGTLGQLIVDERLYQNLNRSAENIATATDAILQGRGVLGRLVNDKDLGDAFGRAVTALGDERGSIGKLLHKGDLYDELLGAVRRFREVGDRLSTGEGTLGKLLTDDRPFESFRRTADNLDVLTTGLREGKGTLGRLFGEDDLYENFRQISESLKKITAKVGDGEGSLGRMIMEDRLYKEAEKFIDTANEVLGGFTKFRTYAGAGYMYHGRQQLTIYRLFLRVEPSRDKFFHAGVAIMGFDPDGDIAYDGQFDTDKGDDGIVVPEAQVGFRFFDRALSLRLGYLEGKPGGGIDLDLALPGLGDFPLRFTLEGRMAYADVDFDDDDVNEDVEPLMLRVQASVMILDHLRVYAGANNLCDRVGFTFGITFEYRDEDIRSMIGFLALGR